jgi:lipooligosaccharide transport system permease protein
MSLVSTSRGGLTPFEGVLRQLDNLAIIYRRTWKGTVFSSFVSPLFYVLAREPPPTCRSSCRD